MSLLVFVGGVAIGVVLAVGASLYWRYYRKVEHPVGEFSPIYLDKQKASDGKL